MHEPPAPVVIHPRDVSASWEEGNPKRNRLVIPAAAAAQFDALPVPDVDLGDWDVCWLDGQSVEVLNLADRRRWRIRRGQCGLGSCCCDGVAWPSDSSGPIPEPEVFDGWMFYMDADDWDALDSEVGRPVSELPFDELIAVVSEARGAGAG